MPASVTGLIDAATAEWDHWGNSTWNLTTGRRVIGHTDDEDSFAQDVIDRYCGFFSPKPLPVDIQDDRYAWSACCVSTIMALAGYSKDEFPSSQSHSTFIRRFVRARNNAEQAAAFWAFRISEPQAVPEPGDIIGCGRGPGVTVEKAQLLYDKTTSYPSHSDIVVAKRAGEIDVIGGNVMDSVTKKTLPITPAGQLVPDDRHPWFVVLKRR